MGQQLQYMRRCFRTTFVVEKLHSEGGVEGRWLVKRTQSTTPPSTTNVSHSGFQLKIRNVSMEAIFTLQGTYVVFVTDGNSLSMVSSSPKSRRR